MQCAGHTAYARGRCPKPGTGGDGRGSVELAIDGKHEAPPRELQAVPLLVSGIVPQGTEVFVLPYPARNGRGEKGQTFEEDPQFAPAAAPEG